MITKNNHPSPLPYYLYLNVNLRGTMKMAHITITSEIIKNIQETVSKGVTMGIGLYNPGHMCIEAAICYALKLGHSDDPICVDEDLRRIIININDFEYWEYNESRAQGMLELSICQLNTKGNLDKDVFYQKLEKHIKNFRDSVLLNTDYPPDNFHLRYYNNLYLKFSRTHYNIVYNYISCISHGIQYLKSIKSTITPEQVLIWFCNNLTKALIEMKTEGSKWLCLLKE